MIKETWWHAPARLAVGFTLTYLLGIVAVVAMVTP
jgi:hypothetical protein